MDHPQSGVALSSLDTQHRTGPARTYLPGSAGSDPSGKVCERVHQLPNPPKARSCSPHFPESLKPSRIPEAQCVSLLLTTYTERR